MMHGCKQVRLSGTIRVPLAPAEAFNLFTPSGERAWVVGWDPVFPAAVADETNPGTVFQTEHDGPQTTWIVVRREPGEVIQYARVTPSDRAGLVSVACSPDDDGITAVTVSYDLTALTPDANAALDEFAGQYPDFLKHWRQAIEHGMGGGQEGERGRAMDHGLPSIDPLPARPAREVRK